MHGSIGRVECESCGAEQDWAQYCRDVQSRIKDIYGLDPAAPKESRNILCVQCGKPTVKPATVLFGGHLPERFFECKGEDLGSADLLIVVGTSLVVQPAAGTVAEVGEGCVRLICNRERVGESLGVMYGKESTRDVHATGDADDTLAALAAKLGWLDDLSRTSEFLPEQSKKALAITRHPTHLFFPGTRPQPYLLSIAYSSMRNMVLGRRSVLS